MSKNPTRKLLIKKSTYNLIKSIVDEDVMQLATTVTTADNSDFCLVDVQEKYCDLLKVQFPSTSSASEALEKLADIVAKRPLARRIQK